MVLTIAIFQKFLISMEVHEISIFFPENYLNDTAQFNEDMRGRYIYIEKFTNIGTSELH